MATDYVTDAAPDDVADAATDDVADAATDDVADEADELSVQTDHLSVSSVTHPVPQQHQPQRI